MKVLKRSVAKLTMRRESTKFSSFTFLENDAPIFGAPAQEWDKFLNANMDVSLAEAKRRALSSDPKRDALKITIFDFSSFAKKRLQRTK